MAQRRGSSGRVMRGRAGSTSKTLSDADLHELARNKSSVRDFTAGHSLHTKSEVGVEEAVREADMAARKQAWAPPQRQRLRSNSSRFRHEPPLSLPPHPNTPVLLPSLGEHPTPDDAVHIEHLDKLRKVFEKASRKGDGKLDTETFMKACDKLFGMQGMNEEQLRIAFKKIDNHSNGSISWDEYCTFLYLEFHERDSAETRAKKVEFHLPAKVTSGGSPHQGSVCAVGHLSDGTLVSCSEEGTVCFWSQELESKRTKLPSQTEMDPRNKPKWISDMALSLPHKKIILATGDSELQFFEMANFEPYCQLKKLESIPLKLVCWHDPQNELYSVILVGDKDGAVMVMMIDNIQDAFKHWKMGAKSEGLPTYSMQRLLSSSETGVKCYRWRLHTSWVCEMHYFSELSSFASCSSDPSASLVLGPIKTSTDISSLLRPMRQMGVATKPRCLLPAKRMMACDQRVFRASKGMSSVDYCPKNNVIVTGSVDRLIRVWNPFMTARPIGVLEGHTGPVFCVRTDSVNSRVYSIGNDNTIMVWDILEFTRLKTVIPSTHKFTLPTQVAHFNSVSQQVVLATDEVAVVQLVLPLGVRQDIVQSHRDSISGVAYSTCFNHLITACRSGVVRVWDMTTGSKIFEFSVGSSGISSIHIDMSGKRIVTGSLNGQLKVWSYNSGECLKTLDKGNICEVSKTQFVSVNQNKYIVAVGWDKKVCVFPDVMDTIQEVYKPLRVWSATTERVHKADILTVAFGAPHLMATAGFDGKIVVWSLVSYHVLNQLKAVYPDTSHPPSTLEGDEAVQELTFLNQRAKSKLSASLVASGPAGYVHFWNIYDSSKPMACFRASNYNCVTSLTVDSDNLLLLTGDIEGYLCLWKIEKYCVSKSATLPPKRVATWRAHTQRVTRLSLVEQWSVIVSASEDTSVRVWTLEGHFIGTFGQASRWKLGDPASYRHPLGPRDILIHTTTTATTTTTTSSQPAEDEKKNSSPNVSSRKPPLPVQPALSVTEVESEEEEEDDNLLKSHGISLEVPSDIQDTSKAGKWLRHYRTQSAKYSTTNSQKVYRLLPYQALDEDPDSQLDNVQRFYEQSQLMQDRK